MSTNGDHSSPEAQPLKEENVRKENFENKNFFQKLWYLKRNITVEPIMAGLIISSMLSRLVVQNLNLDKACRVRLNYTNDICDSLIKQKEGNFTLYEGEVQKIISSIEAWKSIVQTAIPIILVIIMGAWSDRTGNRKLCILLPIFGEFLVCISNILSTFFFYEISIEVTMFLEALFPAITGGWVMVYLGVFSYVSDITDAESRTFRIGLVNLCLTGGVLIGTALSGILLKFLGYYSIFTLSGSIYLVTFIYGYFYLKTKTKPGIEDNKQTKPITVLDLVTLVKETTQVAFKKREGNLRMKIIFTLSVVAIVYGPNHGERLITYLFVRYRLQWDAFKYSIYSTYSVILHSVGALFSISVFSKHYGFHDSMLCIISISSKLVGSVFLAYVRTDFQMFMVPVVEILNATTFTSLRSLASKLVCSEEIGKMNSLFSLVETLAALVFDPTYSTVYAKTVSLFTGTVYLFSGIMTIPALGILMWLFTRHRRETKLRKQEAMKQVVVSGDTKETVQ
ncbi:unnamed protein product, partial [Brenthis ino]